MRNNQNAVDNRSAKFRNIRIATNYCSNQTMFRVYYGDMIQVITKASIYMYYKFVKCEKKYFNIINSNRYEKNVNM